MMIISMRIRMQGFVVFDFESRYAEARRELAQWLSEGKLKRKETIVQGGIGKAEEALVGLFEGRNTGTLLFACVQRVLLMRDRQDHGAGCRPRGSKGQVVGMMRICSERVRLYAEEDVFLTRRCSTWDHETRDITNVGC